MLDLTRVNRDLESTIYGAMSHVVGVMSRVIRASGVVAAFRGQVATPSTVFIHQCNHSSDSHECNRMYQWPDDPSSAVWHSLPEPTGDRAVLFYPQMNMKVCAEIATMTGVPEVRQEARCMGITFATAPDCYMLFIRDAAQPAFTEEDCDRALRYVQQCGQIIRIGAQQENASLNGPIPFSLAQHHEASKFHSLDQLSSTERLVLDRLAQRETEKQVAEALSRSPNTVHVHVKSIYRKLRVNNRRELLVLLERIDASEQVSRQFEANQQICTA